ncbi:ribokinase [Consotaella aegiceratis]|uniref:ribokinase n=1 Tax=Consotaella aegiceratis TaxID=3097961 RepID=UPI002F42E887
MTIVVFGSINVDITAYAPRLPRPGETVHGDSYAVSLGGKGANQAVAVARLGAEVALAGRTGVDTFGTLARERLTAFVVGLDHLMADPANPTGIAAIGVDAKAENCITVVGGANMAVDETDVKRLDTVLAGAQVLLLQLEVPLAPALQAAERVRAAGGIVVLDPAPAPEATFPDDVWRTVHAMTPNESETEALVGIRPVDPPSAARAAAAMIERGLAMAVVKMGAGGVYWRSADGEGHVPTFPVTPIDTVAAGDCFNGGLAVALARGDRLEDAVRFASACGALATTKRGASDAAPTLDEVSALLEANPEH